MKNLNRKLSVWRKQEIDFLVLYSDNIKKTGENLLNQRYERSIDWNTDDTDFLWFALISMVELKFAIPK